MPTTVEALVVIALVLAPGYIMTRTANRVISQVDDPPDLRFLLSVITWGIFVHALLSPWTSRILNFYLHRSLPAHRWEVVGWGITTILIAPFLLGILALALQRSPWIDNQMHRIGFSLVHRTPTAWQYVIGKAEPAYVRVHLKDGRVVGGAYSNRSFASANPHYADLYLERCWLLDEDNEFQCAVENSEGVWISHEVIGHVEFLKAGDDDEQANNPSDESRVTQTSQAMAHRSGTSTQEPGRVDTATTNKEAAGKRQTGKRVGRGSSARSHKTSARLARRRRVTQKGIRRATQKDAGISATAANDSPDRGQTIGPHATRTDVA